MTRSADERTQLIVNGPIAATLIRLTLPMVGGIIALMLLGAVDAYFVAQLGTTELAALGFVLPLTHGVNSIGLGMGIGTSVLISRYLGQGDFSRAAQQVTDGRYLVLLCGVVLLIALHQAMAGILGLMGARGETLSAAKDYLALWIPVIPLLLLTLTGNTTLRAVGSPGKSAFVLALLALLNAALDPLLIFGYGPVPGLGIAGAGLATSVAWVVTYGVSHHLLSKRERLITRSKLDPRRILANWHNLLGIAIPAILANLMTPAAAAIMTAMVAQFGPAAVAGFAVSTRLEALALLAAFALSSTLPMFIGQNLGADKPDRARRALFGALRVSLIFQLLVWAAIALCATSLAALFSDSTQVAEVIHLYLWIVPASHGAQTVAILVMVSLNALRRPTNALMISILRLLVLTLPLAYFGGQLWGLAGLFGAYTLGNCLAGLLAWWIVKRVWDRSTRTDERA